jgi:CheY-like chemotaxis protein
MKILLASTDASASASLTESLRSLGLPEPGCVSDSNAAVDWINSHSGCDLLITEVYLAPMDGFALRDFLVQHLPDLKIAFTSVYDISPYADRLEGAPFIPQPCDTAFLRKVLETLIALPEAHQPPAAPSPTPVVTAPVAVAKASAPKPVVQAATPVAKVVRSSSQAATPVAKVPSTTPQPAAPPDPRVGTTLGNYLLEARIGATPTETLYRAKQTTVGRQVILRVLNTPESGDSSVAQRFMEDARAKAKVSHTLVTAVYEGGEQDGTAFCSGEFVAAPNLAMLAAQNKKLDGPTALKVLKSCADVLGAFEQQGIAHHPLQASSILLPPGSVPRIANPACQDSRVTPAAAAEMASIGSFLLPLLDSTPASAPARGLLTRLQSGEAFAWPALAEAAESLLPKAVPADAAKIQAQDITRQKAASEARA